MRYTILMMIKDGRQGVVEASAFSKESASIYIYAGSWQQAQELLTQGQDLAAEACRNWNPEDVQQEEDSAQGQKHHVYYRRGIEEMQEAAQEYEESPKGQRFSKSIENAKQFTLKHSKDGCVCAMQLNYIANKYCNSLINGSFDLMALAYRRGYTNGKADAKKSRNKCRNK